MMSLSKALNPHQVATYHLPEMRNTAENYYAGPQIESSWRGTFAADFGFSGPVDVSDEAVIRLANGQHPLTGETLIASRSPTPYTKANGTTVTPMAHRAAWDATFSAPKSVSLVAFAGGDQRVVEAHRVSVDVALRTLERYTQARGGGNKPSVTTGRALFALFEHDSARPVDGYAAPQLHTHALLFNLTRLDPSQRRGPEDHGWRSLQSQSWFQNKTLGTAVYRNELARRLTALGYDIQWRPDTKVGFVPEISGITEDYRDASSPRRARIVAALDEAGRTGAAAAQVAALATREAKIQHAHEAMQRRHQEIADSYGNQADTVVTQSRHRGERPAVLDHEAVAEAVTFATDRNVERDAIVPEPILFRDALIRGMGRVDTEHISADITRRAAHGELLPRVLGTVQPIPGYTTPLMVEIEQAVIDRMRQGHQQHAPLVSQTAITATSGYDSLSVAQRAAIADLVASRDTITAFQGRAGVGKTRTLTVIAEALRAQGYDVRGLAPTGTATDNLAKTGIPSMTLQRHLMDPGLTADDIQPRVFVLDEASLASARQLDRLVAGLPRGDRLLVVGDSRQHQSVEAGRMFEQLQEAGMRTTCLDVIVRQQDPALKAIVAKAARHDVAGAMADLIAQQRVHEIPSAPERLKAIARIYAEDPDHTIVIDPINDSRAKVNAEIQAELHARRGGAVPTYSTPVLVPRQDLTGPDRGWARQYAVGNVIRYTRGSKPLGVEPGDYATVQATDPKRNLLTVQRRDGSSVTYSPVRLQGVSVFRQESRDFAIGDRVQFTLGCKAPRVRNRACGTIAHLNGNGAMRVQLDNGHRVTLPAGVPKHLDYGYAVTSYSAQGLTRPRELFHLDADYGGGDDRTAYVAWSRAESDLQVFTNDTKRMEQLLMRNRSHTQAIAPTPQLRMTA